jgi:hypothetical protein
MLVGKNFLAPDFTVINGNGTYFDSNGIMQSASTNTPRFTYDINGVYQGLLIESPRTNQVLNNLDMADTNSWSVTHIGTGALDAVVTANQAISPDGTMNADRVVFSCSGGSTASDRSVITPINITTITDSQIRTFSVWMRSFDGVSTYNVRIRINGGAADVTVTGSWQRFSVTASSSSDGTRHIGLYKTINSDTADILIWGAQIEVSAWPSSTILTTGVAKTRTRDDIFLKTPQPARTNSIRNNTMVGAVNGSPGTVPNNWGTNLQGLTRTISNIGSTQNGVPYIDIRFSGTATAGQAYIIFDPAIVASNGETWTESVYLLLFAGSFANVSSPFLQLNTFDADGNFINQHQISISGLNATFIRYILTATLSGAAIAKIQPLLTFQCAAAAIDFTIRICAPQLELGASASTNIPTTNAAVLRPATTLNWYNSIKGTMYANFKRFDLVNDYCHIIDQNDNITTGSDTMRAYQFNNTSGQTFCEAIKDSIYVFSSSKTDGSNIEAKVAYAYELNNFAVSVNGTIPTTDTSCSVPNADTYNIGRSYGGYGYLNGTIKEARHYLPRLNNKQLTAISKL